VCLTERINLNSNSRRPLAGDFADCCDRAYGVQPDLCRDMPNSGVQAFLNIVIY
jgi:hypothetical protein